MIANVHSQTAQTAAIIRCVTLEGLIAHIIAEEDIHREGGIPIIALRFAENGTIF